MTIDDQIRDEKLQYDINRKAAEISALSSSKIDKYEYLTGKDILKTKEKSKLKQFRTKEKLTQLKNILMIMKILH